MDINNSQETWEYIVVPFVGRLRNSLLDSADVQSVSAELHTLINHYASQNWLFYSIEKINIHVEPGCLASLLGVKVRMMTIDQIIFRRPLAEGSSRVTYEEIATQIQNQQLAVPTSATATCPHCGQPAHPDAKHCRHCYQSIERTSPIP